MSPPSESPPRGRDAAAAFGLALLVVAWFAPVRSFAYLNFDDDAYVTDNPFVRNGLSWANVHDAFTHQRGGHYHPLTWISHMLDVSLFGLRPGPAHLVNVAIHAATVALVYLLVRRLLGRRPLAAFVALAFGLHPLRLESVAWIAERKDVLALFFALLTFHAWLGFVHTKRVRWYALTLLTFALGLLAKPTLAPLPLLLLTWDLWPLARRTALPWRALVREKAPLFALAAASVLVTTATQRREGALVTSAASDLGARLATAGTAYLAYAAKLVWPSGLGIFYPLTPYPPGVGSGAWLGLAGLTAIAWGQRRRFPALLAGWLWFVVALLPVVGFVQFGGQALADRWTYLPHLGLLCGLAATVRPLLDAWQTTSSRRGRAAAEWLGRRLPLLAILVLLLEAAVLRHQLPHWASSESLFRHTLEVSPNNFMAHTNLGQALDAAGKLDEAALHYEEAARLNPTYPEALNNLGSLKARRSRFDEAEALFRRALAIRPDMLLARYNLGLAVSRQGRQVEAATAWMRVLAREPHHPLATDSLAFVTSQILLPACRAGQLRPASATAGDFLEAFRAWQPTSHDEPLHQAMSEVAHCMSQ